MYGAPVQVKKLAQGLRVPLASGTGGRMSDGDLAPQTAAATAYEKSLVPALFQEWAQSRLRQH